MAHHRFWRGVPLLVVFVASCMLPPGWQQGPYGDQSGDPQQAGPPSQYGDSGDHGNGGYGNDGGDRGYGNGNRGGSSSQWLCRAVGSYVPSGSDGPDYSSPQNVDASKVGRTRDEAGIAALDACSGMLSISTNISIYPNALVTNYCRVISCSQ